jgi:TM2 domain-containing membrane protein YozV
MFCKQCGAQMPDDSTACARCGAAVDPSQALQRVGQPVRSLASLDPTAKSKLTAGLLGIFLGGFGVHRFYLGYTKLGVIQLVVSILTCGFGGLWGLVEGILIVAGSTITTDASGRPLRE